MTDKSIEINLSNLKAEDPAIQRCYCLTIGVHFQVLCSTTGELEGTMPIYEYECTSCCNVFEVFQRMTENPLNTCPDCAGAVKKLVSRSSFQLKGSGWYADGYSSKSTEGTGSAVSDTATPSVSEKSVDSSSDSSTKTPCKEESTATP